MTTFKLSAVYGPSRRPEKEDFLRHLRHLKPEDDSRWLLLGDFNFIYKARDKNNRNLNLRLMSRFRRTLDFCELKELSLQNRKYTWSNERRRPTLVRLDRVFCNQAWVFSFANCGLHALSSSHSDHYPLLLTNQDAPRRPAPFKFENFWTRLPRFQEVVASVWQAPTSHTEPFHHLGHKLFSTAQALKKWSGSLLSDARLKLLMAQEVILRLDEAQDSRTLSMTEFNPRTRLKKRILGWLVVEKARKKQSARISHIKEGDANTYFFHLRANDRRRKNFIQRLRQGNRWLIKHVDKQQLVQRHFEEMMRQPPPRNRDFAWADLALPAVDLSSLDRPFTHDEVWHAICLMPQDKAPGPDGFTRRFFKLCWPIIQHDFMAAIHSLYNSRSNDLNLLNKANIILIPKKDGAESIGDFRPISLIHGVAKIITKVLALRLAPLINELISPCQSAFIKRRSIHDNFLYVRNLTRRFHRTKSPAIVLKLDISKAFDSVRWDYLLSLMQRRGFPLKWRNWISALLATSTSRVMLNGIPIDPILHGRGLR
jgi:hypothetical protein